MLYLFFLITFFSQAVVCANTDSITLYQGLSYQTETHIDLNQTEEINYSIHFLLTTIGRKTIFRMLDSLKDQFKAQDYLTIVFDGKDIDNVYSDVQQITQNLACTVNIFFEPENLGFWGHGIRNKYASLLQGDFVMHCDDDNRYCKNSLAVIRKICQDRNKLYIFKVVKDNRICWEQPAIIRNYIDTACGVIPVHYNTFGTWGYFYEGDLAFYNSMAEQINDENIVFVDFLIYEWLGYNRTHKFDYI